MNFGGVLGMLGELFPLFVQWLKWLLKLPDKKFEEITKAWPAPTKTKLAWIRAEAKAHDKFFEGLDNE